MATRSIRFEGFEDVRRRLKRLKAEVGNKAVAGALFVEGEAIMAESKKEVPVDEGVLRSTGHVDKPRRTAGVIEVEMGYGGPAAPYALRQHEDLTLRHKPGQKAKYLEDPFNRRAPKVIPNVARAVDRAIERELGPDRKA